METIFLPTIRAMAAEGRPFKGCLYFGLMITKDGPKVIEYNCRFGDPETQVVLPLLESDLLTVMMATAREELDRVEVTFSSEAACCVVKASGGYPQKYQTGYEIHLPSDLPPYGDIIVAGAKRRDGVLVTGGGRVLCAVAKGQDLEQAIERAYEIADSVHFENEFCRRDIGASALRALR